MDEQLIKMMGKMMKQMNDMQSDMKSVKTDVAELKSEMNIRFDSVDAKLVGVGEHFEEMSKNTVQLRDEVKKELKYVTRKINELDREVFMRTESLQ